MVISVAHRTIILYGMKELQRVYELCCKEYFDDYVLFWPMINDVQRLSMAVTHALRDLKRSQSGAPAVEMARQVRRIAESPNWKDYWNDNWAKAIYTRKRLVAP